jgi:major membrane immunogen (membrane-anchored lipoprotein)
MKKKLIISLLLLFLVVTFTGCGKNNKETEKEKNEYKSIVISNVDKDTRWEAISSYDITLEFKDGKCVSENYRLEFLKESNAAVYGLDMEGKTYIEDYKQDGNVVTYKRTGTNNEFYDQNFDEAYNSAKMLYSNATITKK